MSRQDLEFAMQMFENAASLDPAFGLAHAALASACAQFYYFCERQPRWMDRARAATAKAAATSGEAFPEVLVAQAWILCAEDRFEESAERARRAVKLKPDVESGYYLLTRVLFSAGKYSEIVEIGDEAIAHSGENYNTYVPVLNAYNALGKSDAARTMAQQRIQVFEDQIRKVPEDARARILLASDYAVQGREADASREATIAMALRPGDGLTLYNAACVFGGLGNKAEALATLKKACAAGFRDPAWARKDPDLALLHGDPEFERLYGPG
jgi:non-specific serine/threonine protein kinase